MSPRALHVWLVLSVAATGCALTNKSEPLQIRYFTPEALRPAQPVPAAQPAAASSSTALTLTLGRVRASSYLRERIAYRASENELGLYDSRRWTERPESYLRRALATRLFQERGIEPVVAGPSATLDVELTAFEHVRAPTRGVRVQVVYVLYGGGMPGVERTVTVERPIASSRDTMLAVARALGDALDETVSRIADDVVAHLRQGLARDDAARSVQCEPAWKTPHSSDD